MILPSALRPIESYIRRLMRRAERANLAMTAAAVAFFGFLAVFPAIAVVIALWGFAADPGIIREEIRLLADFLPQDAYRLLTAQVEGLLRANTSQLGWTTFLSFTVALWSARAGVSALLSGLNSVHHWPERSGVHSLLMGIALTLALVAIAMLALIATVVVPVVLAFLPLGGFAAVALQAAQVILALVLLVLGLALIYRFGPNRPAHHTPRLLTRGLLVALLLWLAVSRGFVVYLANFNSYNQIYGSIGAVVILMMWVYFSAYALLLGAAVDADHAEQTHSPP